MDVILHRTLVIRLSSIGDILLSSPLLRALRRRFPEARIDYLVREEYADLVRWNPYVSATITFPQRGGWRDLLALRQRIRTAGYDLLIDIHDSLRSRVLTAGLPVVRIRKRKLARFLLVHTHRNLYDRLGGSPPVASRYLETVQGFGVEDDGSGPELTLPPGAAERAARAYAEAGIPDGMPVIGVCPGARHATKRWPPERFGAAAALLARSRHAAVAVFGGADEQAAGSDVRRALHKQVPEVRVLDAVGLFSLGETAAALDRCAVVLTNDSGLLHMACARRRPVVAVFGSTVREFGFFPESPLSRVAEVQGLDCRPCSHIGRDSCPAGHFRCMLDITGEEVHGAAELLLQASS